jgi:hypothetical protein
MATPVCQRAEPRSGPSSAIIPIIIYIAVYQYNETNVMHFSFSSFRTKGIYMFRALLAHPQEVLHKRHLVYCVRVMSVGCTRNGVALLLQS